MSPLNFSYEYDPTIAIVCFQTTSNLIDSTGALFQNYLTGKVIIEVIPELEIEFT